MLSLRRGVVCEVAYAEVDTQIAGRDRGLPVCQHRLGRP